MSTKTFTTQELKKISHEFSFELSLAKKNQGSLKFEKNKIGTSFFFVNKKVQVIYVGSSHAEFATINYHNQSSKILDFTTKKIDRITTGQDLINLIIENLDQNTEQVVITFAAHLQTTNNKSFTDSILRNNHRIHDFSFLLNKSVGAWISEQIEQRIFKKIHFSALNNLVSLGLSVDQNATTKTILGVVASGVNFGFLENGEIINLESGKFKYNQSEVSTQIGEEHLWKVYNRQAAQQNLELLSKAQDFRIVLNSENLAEKNLANIIFKRSAQLVGAKICGLVKGLNWNKEKINFIIEGSLFWEVENYRELVLETLSNLGANLENLQFVRNRHSFLIGSSKIFVEKPTIEKKKIRIIEKIKSQISILNWSSLAPPA
jgi:hypothetical protein